MMCPCSSQALGDIDAIDVWHTPVVQHSLYWQYATHTMHALAMHANQSHVQPYCCSLSKLASSHNTAAHEYNNCNIMNNTCIQHCITQACSMAHAVSSEQKGTPHSVADSSAQLSTCSYASYMHGSQKPHPHSTVMLWYAAGAAAECLVLCA
jgi:hypothetical protein